MKDHMDETQRLYLMSAHCLAVSNSLTIPTMKGYFSKQVTPDISSDPKKYWEVIDRTTEKVVPPEKWSYSEDGEEVTISETEPFHEYTVTFLARAIWDPTQMYNHITNDWGDKEHDIPFDVRKKHSNEFIHSYMEKWL